MKRNKKVYENFVCPYCWNTLDMCTCKLFPPYHTIFIDKNIQEHIRILNEKKYHTIGCCEGHRKKCLNTYIAFADDYFSNINIPERFKYDKKNYIISYTYSTRLSKEKMEEIKNENLANLLEWCKGLQNRRNL